MVKRLRRRKWMQRMLRRRIDVPSCWWLMRRWIAPLPPLDRHFDCSCYYWWSYNQFQTCNRYVDCRPKRRIDQSLYFCYGILNGDVRSENVVVVVDGGTTHRWRCYCLRRPVQRQKTTHRSGLCLFSSWWSG